MTRRLPLLLLAATLSGACIVPPGDAAQIRRLEKERAAAIARGDRAALYRLHDLDFRATCPFDRFQAPPRAAGGGVLGAIEVRGVRAWATTADGGEQRSFVRDGGRWYLYESAEACLGAAASHARGADGSARGAGDAPAGPAYG